MMLDLIDQFLRHTEFFNNIAVSRADRMGKFLSEKFMHLLLYKIAVFIGKKLGGIPVAVFIDLPLIPDLNIAFLKPPYIIGLRLIDPQHLQHRLPDEKLFCGQDRKFLFQIKTKVVRRYFDGIHARSVYNFRALCQNPAAQGKVIFIPFRRLHSSKKRLLPRVLLF